MWVTPACFILVVCLTRTLVQAQVDCQANGCQNGGTCPGAGNACICTFAFSGSYCEGIVIDIELADGQTTIEEGQSTTFNFNRQNSTSELIVDYAFTGTFNHTEDTDLGQASGTLTFPAGIRRDSINLVITSDGISEIDETATITLSGQGTYKVSETLTILANDPITVSAESSMSEGGPPTATCTFPNAGGSLTFTVSLAGGTTATPGSDYTGSGGSVICTDTASTVNLPYVVQVDDIPELNETMVFVFTYASTDNAQTGQDTTVIVDDDDLTISETFTNPLPEDTAGNISLASAINFDVGSATSGTFPIDITFTAIGDATAGSDYQVAETTSTINYDPSDDPGSFNDLFLTIINDMDDEPNTEGIQITFSSALSLTGDVSFNLTIQDDDPPTVTYSITTSGTFENQTSRRIVFTRNTNFEPLSVNVTSGLISAQADDFTAVDDVISWGTGSSNTEITVTIADDDIVEDDEVFVLDLVGSSTDVIFDPTNRIKILIDNDDEDYMVSIRLFKLTLDVVVLDEEDGFFNISLSRVSSFGILPVTVTVTSSDATGSDYTFSSSSLQFEDGETTIAVPSVEILDDEIPEPTETLNVTVTWQSFTESSTLKITDTDPFIVTFTAAPTVQEEDGFYNYTLTRNADHESTIVSVVYATDPGSSDFSSIAPKKHTFPQNELSMIISVPLTDDSLREQDDYVNIQVTGVDDDVADEPVMHNLTVVNVDLDTVTATATDTPEDDGSITVTVTRLATFDTMNVTVSLGTCADRCAENDDYTLTTTELMFEQGSDTVSFTITLNADTVLEADESLVLAFTPEASKGSPTSLTVKILNDDPEIITLPPLVGAFEDDGEITVEFTRTLDLDPKTINITTADDTAKAGVDYTGLSMHSLTFPSGSLKAYLEINITDDMVDDPDKVFKIQVTGENLIVMGQDKDAHIFDNEGGRIFNCLRNGQNCTGGEGDFCDGLPICYCNESSRSGDQCNVLTDNIIPCDPEDKCSGNGICTNVTNDCTCDDGYYGDECQHYFLYNMCNISSMVVIANPVGFFNGEIYVYGHEDVEECHFKPLDELEDGVITDDTLKGYGLVIHHQNSSCGDILPVEDGDITSYTRGIFVAYTEGLKMSIDQYVSAVCSFNNSNFELVIGNVTIVEDSDSFVQENVQNLASPVVMDAFVGITSLTADSVVALDTDVGFRLSVPEPFKGIAIRDIWLENGLTGNDTKVFTLYREGCVQSGAKSLLGPIQYETVGNTINKAALTFEYKAIAFDNSDRVVTYVTLRICINSTNCEVTCNPTTVKKRAAPGDTTVWTVFRVDTSNYVSGSNLDSVIIPKDATSGPVVSKEKSGTVQFVPTIAGLGVAAGILILICVAVLFALLRKRRKPLKMES